MRDQIRKVHWSFEVHIDRYYNEEFLLFWVYMVGAYLDSLRYCWNKGKPRISVRSLWWWGGNVVSIHRKSPGILKMKEVKSHTQKVSEYIWALRRIASGGTVLHGDALTYSNVVSIDMEINDHAAKISRRTGRNVVVDITPLCKDIFPIIMYQIVAKILFLL